jgi:hypothetical protein
LFPRRGGTPGGGATGSRRPRTDPGGDQDGPGDGGAARGGRENGRNAEGLKNLGPLLEAGKKLAEARVDLVKAELAYRTEYAQLMELLGDN